MTIALSLKSPYNWLARWLKVRAASCRDTRVIIDSHSGDVIIHGVPDEYASVVAVRLTPEDIRDIGRALAEAPTMDFYGGKQ